MTIEKIDFKYLNSENDILLGSDEVGRGCLAGNVVTCSVMIEFSEKNIKFLNDIQSIVKDSKKLSPKKRKDILKKLNIDVNFLKPSIIIDGGFYKFYISERTPEYIDEYNILKSTMDAFYESYNEFMKYFKNFQWIIDGNKKPKEIENLSGIETVTKGDQKSLIIGLASIIAKEYRDYQMEILDKIYPNYLFSSHKGYGTQKHYEAIKKYGLIENIHRKSFLKNIK